MGLLNGNNKTRTIVSAVLTRKDGTVINLGVIADSKNGDIQNENITENEEVKENGIRNNDG